MAGSHPKVGNLWVRRLKNGRTYMVGYFIVNTVHGAVKRVFTVKAIANPKKFNAKQPDYCIYDYTKEQRDGKRKQIALHNSHPAEYTE